MYRSFAHSIAGCALPAIALSWSAGCTSTQPDQEIGAVEDLVAERSGLEVTWQEPWRREDLAWPPEGALGPQDAARLALSQHADMRVAIESVVQARAEFAQAHLLPNPVLNATIGLPVEDPGPSPAMATLLFPFVALWQRPAQIDIADQRLRATVFAVSETALDLARAARSAHANLVYAERDLELERRRVELLDALAELVEQRRAEGEASRLDSNRAQQNVVTARLRSNKGEIRRDQQLRVLLSLCGVAERPEEFVWTTETVPLPDEVRQLGEAELVLFAESQRLDLAAARALLEGAVDGVRLEELRRLRRVSVGGGFQRNFRGQDAFGPSLQIDLPLFDDGRAQVARAESLVRATEAEVEALRQAVIEEVRLAWVHVLGDLERLDLARQQLLDLAVRNRELAEISLEAGIGDRVQLLEFSQLELLAQLEVNQLELHAIESFLELERALGGAVPETSAFAVVDGGAK